MPTRLSIGSVAMTKEEAQKACSDALILLRKMPGWIVIKEPDIDTDFGMFFSSALLEVAEIAETIKEHTTILTTAIDDKKILKVRRNKRD